MNIALLGGAFNPPHLGHVFVAQQILDFTETDEVWLLPNYGQHPPKPVAPFADRVEMSRFLETERIKLSTLEIDNKLNGQTINLLPYLPPGNDYSFVIGSDQLAAFHLWGSYLELVRKIPFLVFPRYGYPNEPLYPGMKVVGSELLLATNISSTKIRGRVRAGLSIESFVPQGVAQYIKEKKLYS